jgi:hypothetical protein
MTEVTINCKGKINRNLIIPLDSRFRGVRTQAGYRFVAEMTIANGM